MTRQITGNWILNMSFMFGQDYNVNYINLRGKRPEYIGNFFGGQKLDEYTLQISGSTGTTDTVKPQFCLFPQF